MSDNKYFQQAIANFTFEEAGGAAIRHLADLGYSAKKIKQHLDYPVPYEKIQTTIWNYFLKNETILLDSPQSLKTVKKSEFIQETGPDGRTSFRRVTKIVRDYSDIKWKKKIWTRDNSGSLLDFFSHQKMGTVPEAAYISCRFGLDRYKDPKKFQKQLSVLNDTQREYVEGLLWERHICYHRLNYQIQEIISCLYKNGYYEGEAYFLIPEEIILIQQPLRTEQTDSKS